jgi:hypothetical protein
MWGRSIRLMSVVALLAGSFIMTMMSASSGAALGKVFAEGNLHCTMTGRTLYGPKLQPSGLRPTRLVIRGTLTCDVGETGVDGVTITGGKFRAIAPYFDADCNTIDPPQISAKIKWTATGGRRIYPTWVTWLTPNSSSNEPFAYVFSNGDVGVAGSYGASPTATLTVISDNVMASESCVKNLHLWYYTGLGGTSEINFAPNPALVNLSSASRGAGSTNQVISINGAGFQPGATVAFSPGTGITTNSVTFISSTQLDVDIDITLAGPYVAHGITVTNPDSGTASCSACFTVTPPPNPTSVSPTSGARGATMDVDVFGSDFVSGAVVSFSGSGVGVNSTTFDNSGHLVANITISPSATTNARNVVVTNPDAGRKSLMGAFTVTP